MKGSSTILIVVLIILLAFSGCAGNDEKADAIDGNASVNDTAGQEKTESGNNGRTDTDKSQGGIKIEIPDGFPGDIIPLLDDAQIDNIITNDTNKAINVNYNTGKSSEEAVTFYKNVMKDGKDKQELDMGDSYIIIGIKETYVVTITIMESQSNTIVNLDTRPESQ